jgi:hypothetical protein
MTVEQHLRGVLPGTYLADVDISEQFHNFIMHASMQAYAGVDLTAYFPDEFLVQAPGKKGKCTLWVRWTRCGKGFKTSPYIAGQAMLFAEEVIHSSPSDHGNCFHFDEVRLNIPGQPSYNPQLPWVSKFQTSTGCMANDFYVYVDDVRTAGDSYESCWQAARTVASKYNYLGLQDAPRKRRAPSTEAGPWAGSTIHTSNNTVTVTVTIERWHKAQVMIQWNADCCQVGSALDHKQLESYRGSLVYLSRTYPSLVPYLKGVHLTLDSWRPNRDSAGWKLRDYQHLAQFPEVIPVSAPSAVRAVPRLLQDIVALQSLFAPTIPPSRPVRPSSTATAIMALGMLLGRVLGRLC